MLLGLSIHYFLRYKFYKSKYCYKNFFDNGIKKIQKKISPKNNFNKSIIDSIKKILKNNELQITKNDLYKSSFWNFFIKNLGIEPDEIFK